MLKVGPEGKTAILPQPYERMLMRIESILSFIEVHIGHIVKYLISHHFKYSLGCQSIADLDQLVLETDVPHDDNFTHEGC